MSPRKPSPRAFRAAVLALLGLVLLASAATANFQATSANPPASGRTAAAGPSSPPSSAASPDPSGQPAPSATEGPLGKQQTAAFAWKAGVGNPNAPGSVQIMSSNGGGAMVPKGAAHLHFDIAWTCSSPTCDLRACIFDPTQSWGGTPPTCPNRLDGSSPLKFDADQPLPGGWKVALFDDSPTTGVSGMVTGMAT